MISKSESMQTEAKTPSQYAAFPRDIWLVIINYLKEDYTSLAALRLSHKALQALVEAYVKNNNIRFWHFEPEKAYFGVLNGVIETTKDGFLGTASDVSTSDIKKAMFQQYQDSKGHLSIFKTENTPTIMRAVSFANNRTCHTKQKPKSLPNVR